MTKDTIHFSLVSAQEESSTIAWQLLKKKQCRIFYINDDKNPLATICKWDFCPQMHFAGFGYIGHGKSLSNVTKWE